MGLGSGPSSAPADEAPAEVAGSPAGTQLARLIEALGSRAGPSELEALFDPQFLQALGAGKLPALLQETGEKLRAGKLLKSGGEGPSGALALFETAGELWRLQVSVAESDGHLLSSVFTSATAPSSGLGWEELLACEPPGVGFSKLPPAIGRRLEELVASSRLTGKIPGLLAAVADESGEIVWFCSRGIAAHEPLAPPQLESAVRIGSVTKTMTATLVMQLVERGLVDLDRDVNDYLTSYEVTGPGSEPVTVRQLATHTSGLGARPGVEIGCLPGAVPALADFYGPRLVGQHPPGRAHEYSNDAFATLGQLVSDVSGRTLEDQAIAELFEPLGMAHTSYLRDGRVSGPPLEGYDIELGELVPVPYQEVIVRGAGSVFSTLEDMAAYGAAVHGRGANRSGRILSEAAFEELTSPQAVDPLPIEHARMCLGWLELELSGARVLWHNGGWYGARSELAVVRESGQTVLVFSNTLAGEIDSLCFEMVAALLA